MTTTIEKLSVTEYAAMVGIRRQAVLARIKRLQKNPDYIWKGVQKIEMIGTQYIIYAEVEQTLKP